MEVFYHGKWGKARHDYPCTPIKIEPQQVHWYGADWYLPAAYGCAQGMVLDLFAAVPEAKFEAFLEKWQARLERMRAQREHSRVLREQAEAENPLSMRVDCTVQINGEAASHYESRGTVWVRGASEDAKTAALLAHYGLIEAHPGMAWRHMRVQLEWAASGRPEALHSLTATLEAEPAVLPFPAAFETAPGCAPFDVLFSLPAGAQHTLHVLGCERDRAVELEDEAFCWPRELCVLRYTVSPALPEGLTLRPVDQAQGDSPRRLKDTKDGRIGGAVGVAILRSKDEGEAAASSLYHDAPQSIHWYLRIDRIPAEPVELRLL